MFVCPCFTNDPHHYHDPNHDPKVTQWNLRLFERRIWKKREDSRHESAKFDKGVWTTKDERV